MCVCVPGSQLLGFSYVNKPAFEGAPLAKQIEHTDASESVKILFLPQPSHHGYYLRFAIANVEHLGDVRGAHGVIDVVLFGDRARCDTELVRRVQYVLFDVADAQAISELAVVVQRFARVCVDPVLVGLHGHSDVSSVHWQFYIPIKISPLLHYEIDRIAWVFYYHSNKDLTPIKELFTTFNSSVCLYLH